MGIGARRGNAGGGIRELMVDGDRDRRGGLIAFGVVQLVLGCLTAIWTFRIVAAASSIAVSQGLLLYLLATLYFIATGIGSMRGRRWARALIAAVSGVWFACGLLFAVPLWYLAGHRWTSIGMISFCALVLPLILTIYYSLRDTALTADALDPKPRWTDHAPVPVLAVCIVLTFAAAESLILAADQRFTFFNTTLIGAPASLAYIALAILFAHLAIQMFRLRQYAWWVLVLLHVIGGAVWIASLTGSAHFGAAAETAVLWTAYLAFLIWLRRRYRMFSG